MERKDKIDAFGATSLVIFGFVLALNQVVIKLGNGGFQPIFAAGLRSVGAIVLLMAWMKLRGIPLRFKRGTLGPGLLLGGLFAFEFVALFWSLDHTRVSHASLLFYSMPVVLSIAAHFLLPGERLSPLRVVGLLLAMGGVGLVLSGHSSGDTSLAGDLAALAGAFAWAGIALVLRLSRLSGERPEIQLFWQLGVSAVILLALSPLFGPFLRDPGVWHVAGLAFQIVAVASMGYLFWIFLISVYPASGVASFAFLTPVLSVLMGWALLGEDIGLNVILAMILVAVGIICINRK